MLQKTIPYRAIGSLFLFLAIAFSLHASFLSQQEISLGQHLTWQAYLFNFIAASVILFFLFSLKPKYQGSLGFIFMGGSLFKFLIFFLFFYPQYKADGEIQTIEFSSFFIPYAICLSIKTFILIRRVNQDE